MKPRLAALAWLLAAGLVFSSALYAQREFRVYRSLEDQADVDLPPDYAVPAEFVVGRLMYPPRAGWRFGRGGAWQEGGTSWAVDYPRGDRTYARLLKRLTTIDVRSVEQPVNLDDGDDVFDWPFLLVGLPGTWELTDEQAGKLRDYLLRGGFLLCDSFFGTREWEGFVESMRRVFPDRPIVDLPENHPIFSVMYDLKDRKQISNWQSLNGRGVPYRADGATPYWRAILDDDGRVMAAILFNNDMGDSMQWADDASYPQEDSALGIRVGVNYALYALTH